MATVTHERTMDPVTTDGDRVDEGTTTTTTATTGVMKMDSASEQPRGAAGDAGTGTGTAGRKKTGNGTKRKRKIAKMDDSSSLFWLVEVRLFVCLFFGDVDGCIARDARGVRLSVGQRFARGRRRD